MIKKIASGLFFLAAWFSSSAQSDSLDIMIGQMIMVGITDFNNDEEKEQLLKLIKQGKIGGIILFEKNLEKENTQARLAKMIGRLQRDSEIPLFMGIDEEGGRVNRLKPKYGFPKSVSAAYIGELDNLDSTKFYGFTTATNLHKFGFNINYAPTVDVNINPDNPVIGRVERSYSQDYRKVVLHAEAFISAHDSMGIATVLKHFPGHGSSLDDTHLGIADVSLTWQFEELYPYRELISKGMVKGIMSAHIVNRTIDEKLLPATLSSKIIRGILRNHLGYQGVVFSDDMHMGAITKHYGTEEAVTLAIQADIDVLMFSNNIFDDEVISAEELHEFIKHKVKSGEIGIDTIIASFRRILNLKQQLGLLDIGYKKELQKRLKKLY